MDEVDSISAFNKLLFQQLKYELMFRVKKTMLRVGNDSKLRITINKIVVERMNELSRESQNSFSSEFIKATCDYVFERVLNEGIPAYRPICLSR